MKTLTCFLKLLLVALPLIISGQVAADQVRVAVASNFNTAITSIAEQFEKNTGHRLTIIFGSTGKHYAQIINGAPYDVFLAADSLRPELLENAGIAIAQSRFTYAIGKLVLWSPQTDYVDAEGTVLEEGEFRFLAIANPKLAPYGRAAQQVLEAMDLWEYLSRRLVRGENIAQTFQFVQTANAQLGFVALAQAMSRQGSFWEVPQSFYAPIEQQAVLLNNNEASLTFIAFVQSSEGQAIIRNHGYDTTGHPSP